MSKIDIKELAQNADMHMAILATSNLAICSLASVLTQDQFDLMLERFDNDAQAKLAQIFEAKVPNQDEILRYMETSRVNLITMLKNSRAWHTSH